MIEHPKRYDGPEVKERLRDPVVLYLIRAAWEEAAVVAGTHVSDNNLRGVGTFGEEVKNRVIESCLYRHPITESAS